MYNSLLNPGWFSIVIVSSGEVSFMIGSTLVKVSAGELYAVPHFGKAKALLSPFKIRIVHCSMAFAIANCTATFGTDLIDILTDQSPLVLKLSAAEFKQMKFLMELLKNKTSIKMGTAFHDRIIVLCFSLILYEYGALHYRQRGFTRTIQNRREKIVFGFIDLVQQYSQMHHDVKFYADLLFVSQGHLGKAVRNVIGMSAKHFIEMAIISLAYSLLANDDLSITDIADNLNFSSTSSFSGFFKKYTNLSPTQYRLNLRL